MIGASLIFSPIVKEKKLAGLKEEGVGTPGTGVEQGWNTRVFRLTSP
jgi:hypothetical protein